MGKRSPDTCAQEYCSGPRVHGFALFEGTGATHGHCPVETETLESVPRSKMTPSGLVGEQGRERS